jgi:hypothetical protein
MIYSPIKICALFLVATIFSDMPAPAQNLDLVGLTLLRAQTTNLDGSGIRVAQPEGQSGGSTNFEVNPFTVGVASNLLTYISTDGVATNYPNDVGGESWHAHDVAANFYGPYLGLATNVAHVDNLDADYFINNYIVSNLTVLGDLVVNQSFTFGPLDATNQQAVDSAYDDYTETYGTFFVSAACNADISLRVCAPGTAYNCISVGACRDGNYYNSIGPTIDNGRCKPDITAPAGATSFSTPQVSGAVALLMQAAGAVTAGEIPILRLTSGPSKHCSLTAR